MQKNLSFWVLRGSYEMLLPFRLSSIMMATLLLTFVKKKTVLFIVILAKIQGLNLSMIQQPVDGARSSNCLSEAVAGSVLKPE